MPLPSPLPTLSFGGVIGTRAEDVERRREESSRNWRVRLYIQRGLSYEGGMISVYQGTYMYLYAILAVYK